MLRYSVLLVLIFIYLGLWSCKEGSRCDCLMDSVKVAKILRPDNSLGKDAVIETISPNKNSGDSSFLAAFSWTTDGKFNIARSLIEFDLSSVPAGTKIKHAYLSLYYKSYQNLKEQTGENAFSVCRVLQGWDENKVTWNLQPFIDTINKIDVPRSRFAGQSYLDIDVTRMVQEMIDFPGSNHGFMIKLNVEFPYRLVILASSDNPQAEKRPRLVIYY